MDMVAAHASPTRIELNGPPILLTREAASALALATNELATNATKYGALSNDVGKVCIGWLIEQSQTGDDTLQLTWQERGGPVVKAPARSGFGRIAIEKSLGTALDGEVVLDFDASGLTCSIRAPFTERLGVRPS
jgi:two-component sensor histidine kinase